MRSGPACQLGLPRSDLKIQLELCGVIELAEEDDGVRSMLQQRVVVARGLFQTQAEPVALSTLPFIAVLQR